MTVYFQAGKSMSQFLILTAMVWFVPFALQAQSATRHSLSEAVKEVTELPRYKTSHWGMLVVDAANGEVLLDHQSDKFFAPASCTKLFSVAAALESLGPDFRFRTPLVHTGKLDQANKTLQGDLILVASGDLTMGGRTLPDGTIEFANNDHTYANGGIRGQLTSVDPLQGLNQLARLLAEKVKSIEGEIIMDDRLFERAESTGSGPGRLTPILINDNLIDFTITPAENVGEPAKIEYRPKGSAIHVDAQVNTVAAEENGKAVKPVITMVAQQYGRYVVRGTIPEKHKPLVRVKEVDDPASHARSLLIDALRKAGVQVKTSSLAVNPHEKLPASDAVKNLPRLVELESSPFSENAKLILKVSHNLHASTLPLLMAAQKQQQTLNQGMRLQGQALKRIGVPLDSVIFGGGAGGARADHVTPRAAVTLLKQMTQREDGKPFRQALPIVGVDGTTAVSVNKDSPARGKFQAKTGTLSWSNGMQNNSIMTSKALSGYGETAKGRQVIFAFFVNHAMIGETGTERAGKDLGRLCEIVFQME